MAYDPGSWNESQKKWYEPPKSTRFFDQSELPDLRGYVHVQSNRQVLLSSQTSNFTYNPFSYPQQKTKSNLPVDFFHLQNKITISENYHTTPPDNLVPTFELTPEQFANPIKFIESISSIGTRYGAVKIIPPSSVAATPTSTPTPVPTTVTTGPSLATTVPTSGPTSGPTLPTSEPTTSPFASASTSTTTTTAIPTPGTPSTVQTLETESFKSNLQINADLFWFQTNRLLNNPNGDELDNRLKFHQELIQFHLNNAMDGKVKNVEAANSPLADLAQTIKQEELEYSEIPTQQPFTSSENTKYMNLHKEDSDMMIVDTKKDDKEEDMIVDTKKDDKEEDYSLAKNINGQADFGSDQNACQDIKDESTTANGHTNIQKTNDQHDNIIEPPAVELIPQQSKQPLPKPDSQIRDIELKPLATGNTNKKPVNISRSAYASLLFAGTDIARKEEKEQEKEVEKEKPKKVQLPSFLNKLPMIDKRPLDLYKLFRSVLMRGGFLEVISKKLWAQIGRELGYRGKIMTSLSSSLKSSYLKILYPFELHLAKMRERKRELPTESVETPTKRFKIDNTPLIIGSPKTFKRSIRLKADKGFLLCSPHLTDVKQPTTILSKKLEFYSVAEVGASENSETVSNASDLDLKGKKKSKSKVATITNPGNKVSSILITPTSQLNFALKSLIEIPGAQDVLQFTSNGRFSSVYTLRQFMEKDIKFQEYLIQNNPSEFNKVAHGGNNAKMNVHSNGSNTNGSASMSPSKFTYYHPKDGLTNSPINSATGTSLLNAEKVPVNSLAEKNVIIIEKLEEMYWKFVSNKGSNPSQDADFLLLQDGLEIENGVSLPSLVNGSGFVRLGDDLQNYKNILASLSATVLSTNSNPHSNSTANGSISATPSTSTSVVQSPQTSPTRIPGAFDGAHYNSPAYSSKMIRSSLNPWNLHNLPVLPNSLLGSLGEHDVNNQDLYTPTLNIGMTFSTENWHAEDHFTQLCNYQFFGGHKKWYFIPEDQFEKFERLIIERTNSEERIHVNNNEWNCEALLKNFTVNNSLGEETNCDASKSNIENEALVSSLENMIPPYLDYNNSRLDHANEKFQKLIDFQKSKRSTKKNLVLSLNQDCFITPEALEEAGIEYTYAIQKPGEFIIKFPKTYSSTISFGLNLSEEVNFATSNWLNYALEGEKWINKQLLLPNFLTFKMLINLAQLHETTSSRNKVYFDSDVYFKALTMYELLCKDEISNREKIRLITKNLKEVIDEKSFADGDAISDDDLKNSFPSKVVITDTTSSMILSLESYLEYKQNEIIDFSSLKVELHLYCSDEKLLHFGKILHGYSVDYGKWTESYEETMKENFLLNLKTFKSLLLDGEKIHSATSAAFFTTSTEGNDPKYSKFKQHIKNLREFVEDANEFVEECQRVLSVKHQQRIRGGSRRRQSVSTENSKEEGEEIAAKSPDDDFEVLNRLVLLLDRIPTLSFHCPEAEQIVEFQTEIENFEKASRNFLESNSGKFSLSSLQEFDDLISLGESFGVILPSLTFLVRLRDRLRWLEDYDIIVAGGELDLGAKSSLKDKHEATYIDDLKNYHKKGLEILGEVDIEKYQSIGSIIQKSTEFDQRVSNFLNNIETIDNISLEELENILTSYETEVLYLCLKNHNKLMKLKENINLINRYHEFTVLCESQETTRKFKLAELNQLQSSLTESGLKFEKDIIAKQLIRSEAWLEEAQHIFKNTKYSTTAVNMNKDSGKQLLSILDKFVKKNEFNFGQEESDNYKLSSSFMTLQEQDGIESDTISETSVPPIYCICREYEAGTMIECDSCKEWYHVQCMYDSDDHEVPENYFCSMCLLVKGSHDEDDVTLNKPKLSKLIELLKSSEALLVYPSNETNKLKQFVEECTDASRYFSERIDEIKQQNIPEKYKLDKIRFYLRKAYGAAVFLDEFFGKTLRLVREYLSKVETLETNETIKLQMKSEKPADEITSIDNLQVIETIKVQIESDDPKYAAPLVADVSIEDINANTSKDAEAVSVEATDSNDVEALIPLSPGTQLVENEQGTKDIMEAASSPIVAMSTGPTVTTKRALNIDESDMEIGNEIEIEEQSTIEVAEENLTEGVESEVEFENGSVQPVDTRNMLFNRETENEIIKKPMKLMDDFKVPIHSVPQTIVTGTSSTPNRATSTVTIPTIEGDALAEATTLVPLGDKIESKE